MAFANIPANILNIPLHAHQQQLKIFFLSSLSKIHFYVNYFLALKTLVTYFRV